MVKRCIFLKFVEYVREGCMKTVVQGQPSIVWNKNRFKKNFQFVCDWHFLIKVLMPL